MKNTLGTVAIKLLIYVYERLMKNINIFLILTKLDRVDTLLDGCGIKMVDLLAIETI